MISYRLATQPPTEPSVKFYKIIAISFLAVAVVLLALVIFITSKKATVVIVAKNDTKSVSLAVGIRPKVMDAVMDASSIAGNVRSETFQWSEDFHPTGNKIVDGVAGGAVVIYNKTNSPQPLVKITRLLTPSGILFRLSEGVTVPANGQVTAKVYADQKGPAYDIVPSSFTIPGLNADKQKVIYAESAAPMTGGVARLGILSQDDLKNAQLAYKQKAREAFMKSKTPAAPGETQIVEAVDSSSRSDAAAGKEVSVFSLSGTSTIVIVTYRAAELTDLINKQIAEKLDASSERFLSTGAAPRVTVASYNAKAGTAELSVYQDVTVTLDANVEALSPEHFFGKKKAEIEQYLLGLDHVASAEVKLSPAWLFSAPSVPGKIKVIVKNVQ